jgi:hypothetical protein
MACSLTQGFPLNCKQGPGGIKNIFLTEQANLATFVASGGTVQTITLNSGKQFWQYSLRKATSEYTESVETNEANGSYYYKDDIKIVLYQLSANKWSEINLLAQNLLLVIVQDNLGNYWLTGTVNGAQLQTSTGKTGKAFGDLNGYDLAFLAEEPQPMFSVPAALMPALTS